MMIKSIGRLLGAILLLTVPVFAQEPESKAPSEKAANVDTNVQETPVAEHINVMRDYHGVRLGMTSEEVRAVMGEPARKSQTWDEFKLDKNDLMTVHYDNDGAKAIQLYFTDSDRAPEFVEVVGDTELTQKENGAKFARRVVDAERFWVSMYQSADKKMTTVSFGRMP